MMLSRKRTQFLALFALALCCSVLCAASAQAQSDGAAHKLAPQQQAKVSICKEIDDDWKCVGQSNEWAANTPFNVLFENFKPVGVDFIGIVFYKQGADGKDTDFVNEYEQQMDEKDTKYATVGDNFKFPAGTYSVYIISWGKRETLMKNGNLKDYFAKTTLTVK